LTSSPMVQTVELSLSSQESTGRPYRTVCAECLTPSSLMSQPECRHEDIMIHQSKQSYPSAPMCCVLDTQLAGVDSGTVVQSLSGQERTREM